MVNNADAYPDDPARSTVPVLTIDSPASLITVGSSPINISGQLDPDAVSLTVNGQPVGISAGNYSASVALIEGHNTVSARMVTANGDTATTSIAVSLDLTPPYITLESHENGDTVYTASVTITGLVNDIVRGTIEEEQALVIVNGVVAQISNRSYAAHAVPLVTGANTISIHAEDQVGNTASESFTLFYQVPSGRRVNLYGGGNALCVCWHAHRAGLVHCTGGDHASALDNPKEHIGASDSFAGSVQHLHCQWLW